MQVSEDTPRYNYRNTWRFRLPTILAAAGLIAISVPTAVIASRGSSGGNHGWWRESNAWPVVNGTLQALARQNPDIDLDAYAGWWGRVYALPPGVRHGGGRAVLAAGVIAAAFAGVGLCAAVLFTDKARRGLFRNFWRAWFAVPVLVSLIAFIYSFVERYTASAPDIDGFLAAGPRPRPQPSFGTTRPPNEPIFTAEGRHSIESWSCAIRPIIELSQDPTPRPPPTPNGFTIYAGDNNPCNAAMTARWMTIPMFVIAVSVWVMVLMRPFWGSRQHAEKIRTVEIRTGDSGIVEDGRTSDQSGKMSSESITTPRS